MKKIFYILFVFFTTKAMTFAAGDNILWLDNKDLRSWDLNIHSIQNALVNATNYLIGIAWTISVIFIIIWAYQILFSSVSWNVQKWKSSHW